MFKIKETQSHITVNPKLIIGFEYLSIIEILNHTIDIEYMTLMTVNRNGYDFTVDGICLPEQMCDGSHTELTSIGEGHVMMELDKNFTVWQHGHVNLPINPSNKDYETLDDFAYKYGKEGYMIMMITNRRGEMVLVYKDKLIECTMDIEIVYDPSKLSIVEDFINKYKSRIREKPKPKKLSKNKSALIKTFDSFEDELDALNEEYFNHNFNLKI